MLSSYTNEVVAALTAQANPEAAIPMAKYMKGKFSYLGIKSPIRKEITRPFLRKDSLPDIEKIQKIAGELWNLPEREFQYFALDLLGKFSKYGPSGWIDFYEKLIVEKSWWDSVDGIAAWLVGDHFRIYPNQIVPTTDKWMASGNIWLQRTCLIFQLGYKDQTDFELMKSFIQPLAAEKEFFIKKAIGWALRQYSKFNPEAVKTYIKVQPLSKLSYKEASKLL